VQFVSPETVLTYRSDVSSPKGGASTRRTSGGETKRLPVPPLGMSFAEEHKRRVQSATGVRKPARLNVGGSGTQPYNEATANPLSARTLPDIVPRAPETKVTNWPSQVQEGSFRIDLSHLLPQGVDGLVRHKTPRLGGGAKGDADLPEWKTPRDADAMSKRTAEAIAKEKEEKEKEKLRSIYKMSVPQRIVAPPQVNSAAREDPCFRYTHDTEMNREHPVTVIKTDLTDSRMLAQACRRAGKIRLEGLAYYKIGVLNDNMRDYKNAIKQYKKFLSICLRTNDVVGEALAYNSIAVDYQLIGGEKELKKSIEYHTKHRDMADIPGKFTAYCNLGIAYATLGQMDKAVYNHQNALRHAIHMSSLEGESLACANLGLTGAHQGDITMAKACVERHLQLSSGMKNSKGQLDARQNLGEIASQLQDFEKAAQEFNAALDIAESNPLETKSAKMAMCSLGIARGDAKFEKHMQQVAESLMQNRAGSRMGR